MKIEGVFTATKLHKEQNSYHNSTELSSET